MMHFTGVLSGILLSTGLYFLAFDQFRPVAPAASIEIAQATVPTVTPPAPPAPAEPMMLDGTQDQAQDQASDQTRLQAPDTPVSAEVMESLPLLPEVQPDSPAKPTATAVFWRPFKSHYSASGFARRMTSATGIEILVLPADKRQYKVAFNYLDEEDRLSKGEVIERITGLSLDGELLP